MSPKRGADDPRLGAPSPADEHPTRPNRPALTRERIHGEIHEEPTGPEVPANAQPDHPQPDHPQPDQLQPDQPRATPGRTLSGGTWVGLILGAIVLIFLLVFVLQNLVPVRVSFLGLHGTLPLGIWLLFAAIAGVLLLAIPGLARLLQWRRTAGRR